MLRERREEEQRGEEGVVLGGLGRSRIRGESAEKHGTGRLGTECAVRGHGPRDRAPFVRATMGEWSGMVGG